MKDKISNFKNKYEDKTWFIFLESLLKSIKSNEVSGAGAELTYFFILSIFPFMIFLLSIISFTPLVGQDVINSLLQIIPSEARGVVSNIALELANKRSETLLSTSIILALWTGSLGISKLFKYINKAYGVKEKRSYIFQKILSLIFTITLALLIIIVLLTLVFGEVIANKIFTYFGVSQIFSEFWQTIIMITPIISLILVFSLLYFIAPSTKKFASIKLRYVLPGAIFTSLGWIIASFGFSYYVRNFASYGATYGSLGGIIILLVWLNLTNLIIVLGAEVNGALKNTHKIINENNKKDLIS